MGSGTGVKSGVRNPRPIRRSPVPSASSTSNGPVDPPLPTRKTVAPRDEFSDSSRGDRDSCLRQAVQAAVEILEQGEALLLRVSPDVYTRKVGEVFEASIGCHYRHCLEHFVSLLNGWEAGFVDYDRRERDPRIEGQPAFALQATRRIREALEALGVEALDREVSTRCGVSYLEVEPLVTRSSVGRELVYGVAHAIHHYALISVIARLLKAELPPDFGVAPATVIHRKAQHST